ncbi:hypothetical protein ACFT2C_04545 [Promicromonospora sp. NPDC057138]|uniref:hypothetical protein n=1 Tax=Promicromonospora sp. NPDC057138 TaxID=3346031 RepID=UPI00363FB940
MTAPPIQPHALEILNDLDALEVFLVEAGGLIPRDAEHAANALTRLINEPSPTDEPRLLDQDWDNDGRD